VTAWRIRNKIALHLIAPLTFLTFLNSLDRVNVSFAALQMNPQLGFSPERYGFGVGLFFAGYLAFQFPHTALLRKIGARRWLFGTVLCWGLISIAMAFIQNAAQFYTLRVLLGVAEAGFAPGIIYFTSQWMPKRFRASAIAGSMLAAPLSIVFGGPLSGWLMSLDPQLGLPGWRFMFLVEGGMTLLVALIAPFYFRDEPNQARWLTPDDKTWLAAERARDAELEPSEETRSFRDLLGSARVWAAGGVWFSLMSGAYGIIYWLPQVIKASSNRSDLQVSMLSALPWAFLGAGMLVNAWHSDRAQERYFHIGLPALLAAGGLALGSSLPPSGVALLCLSIGAFGLGSAQGAFWALPTSFLPRAVAGAGITLINLLGNVGGLIAPPSIGWIRARTGSFNLPVLALAALMVAGAALLLVIRRYERQSKSSTPPPEGAPRRRDFDPLDPATLSDPHRTYRALRRECPIAHSEQWGGFWILSRYDDILAVTKQHETYVNSIQNVVPAVTTTGRRPPLHFDPPEHTQWRKAMSSPFKLHALGTIEDKVRARTQEMLEPLLARGHAELMSELAGTLPVLNLCVFLNAPEQDAPAKIKALSEGFLHAYQERDSAALERESRKLYALAADLLRARKEQPLDPDRDVASAILQVRIDGELASEDLMQGAMRQLLVAGHVAVTMMIGSCAYHLARDPGLQQLLRNAPERIDAALDELLRLYTPNQGFCRASPEDTQLLHQTVRAREPVVLSYPSANRDETKFEAPDEFRFDRSIKHLAFGNGVHKCPGEQLARLELRIFLEELLRRTRNFTLDGDFELARWPEFGPRRLPLRFEVAESNIRLNEQPASSSI
jgi:ACS family tartrate transporter-like MFS transporter